MYRSKSGTTRISYNMYYVKNIFDVIYSLALHPELGLPNLTKRFYHIQLINTL